MDTTLATEVTTATSSGDGTTSSSSVAISGADIAVIVIYFLITLGVGLWATITSSRKSVKGYFLAGKNMVWWPVGASIFASNIGAGHFVGLAGSGAVSGIAVVGFEWLATYIILLIGWVFVPIYVSSNVYTVPEYLQKRYGGQRLRVATSIVSMILYVLTKIAVDLYSGALFIQQTLGINLYLAIVSLLAITTVYTIFGGLKAVIYTDTMQTVIMLIGGIIVMILGFNRIGGYEALQEQYMNALPQTAINDSLYTNGSVCGQPRADSFHMLRHPIDSDIPWPGIFMSMLIMGSWYWCTDQVIVQRTLAANSIQDAKGGCVLAALLKISPMYIMVMAGMISRVLFPDEVACSVPEECERICQNPVGCSNIAYPKLVLEVLPSGLRGLMVAAMLSALMSTLTSVFNSTSTIFTLDIWKRFRKSATERELLIVGKVTILVLVGISILWIPVLTASSGGQIFVYLNTVLTAIGPPVFALYFLGIVWARTNETGAFWGLLVGFSSGMIRLVLDTIYPEPACGQPETRPVIVRNVSYLYISGITFAVTAVIVIIVSLLTKPPKEKHLYGTTWKTLRKPGDKPLGHHNYGPQSESKRSSSEDIDNHASNIHICRDLCSCKKVAEKETGDSVNDSDQKSDKQDALLPKQNGHAIDTESAMDDTKVKETKDYHLSDMYEDPKWTTILNGSAIFVMVIMAFLVGYYA